MPKRKLISLLRKCSSPKYEKGTDLDLSSDYGTAPKRIKPDLSVAIIDDQEHSSDFEQESLSLSSDEDNEQDGNISEHSIGNLQNDERKDVDTEEINENQYDGYQSFMKAFQIFSDEESCESDTQDNPQIPIIKKGRKKSKKKYIPKENYESLEVEVEEPTFPELSQFALFNEDYVKEQTISDNVRVLSYCLKNLEIVFMDHPSSVPIVGYLRVTLIAGKASIQGYALKINKPVVLFSQKQTGILSITSHYCEEENVCAMQNNVQRKLSHYLLGAPANHIKDYMKRNMSYSSAVFILQGIVLSPPLQFLQQYCPFATSFGPRNWNKDNDELKTQFTGFTENEENILNFGSEYEEIFSSIHKHLLRINRRRPGERKAEIIDSNKYSIEVSSEYDSENGADFKKVTGFRILISGPKKAGKSTMLRYLVNSFLNKYPEVYYLDTDPGQSEFTPPGNISLVRVTRPVFGPPYSHIRKPLKMVFTGTITPETSPPMHMRGITKLIKFFNSNFPDSILVVNTIGWLTGVGNLIREHIRKTLVPTVEIELSPTLSALNISVEGKLLKCTVGFERNAASSTKQGDNRPADLRDYALLAYIGQCQTYYLQPQPLNTFRPVNISWEKIAVYNFNKRLMHNRYYEALNGSVVALCHVKKSCMLSPTSPDYPLTLEDEPDNDCLGYGLVRAVNEEQHLISIVTPLSCNTLNDRVNAILSGNILLPRDVIFEQTISNVELEYTDGSEEGKTELRRAITKRSRGHSSNDRIFY